MNKLHLLGAFLAFATAPVCAQELLQNGDFSDGTSHWRGDGKPAASETSTDLITNSNPSNGIAVEMRSKGTTLWQEIDNANIPQDAGIDITLTYSTSSDFALRVRHVAATPDSAAHDFTEPILLTVSRAAGVSLGKNATFTSPTGGFYWAPDTGGVSSRTLQKTITLPSTSAAGDPTWFKLWFPPGSGIIFFTKISVSPHNGPVPPSSGSALSSNGSAYGPTGNSPDAPLPSGTTAPASPAVNPTP